MDFSYMKVNIEGHLLKVATPFPRIGQVVHV